MPVFETFTLTIPGFTIAAKAWGNPQLPPLLALHGWLDNANSFDLLAPFLMDHFYVIAIDLPGHGLSSHLPDGLNYHFIDGIFNVITIIHALGFEQIHLLGHSMGACLASLVAGVVPDKILSMALIEALGPFSHPDHTCAAQLAFYAKTLLLQYNKKTVRPYHSWESAATARAKNGHLAIEEARVLCERGVVNDDSQFYWRHDRRLVNATPLRLTEPQILSCLHAIQAPSCLILASDGFNFEESLIQQRIDAVANLVCFNVAGGHHVHMERPEVIADCLKGWIEGIITVNPPSA